MTRTGKKFGTQIASVTVAIGAVFALSGCYNGFGATTNAQNTMSTGNGAQAQTGAVKVENATLVRGEGNTATLIMTVVNNSDSPDTMTDVEINGQAGIITDGTSATGPLIIEPGAGLAFGYGNTIQGPVRWVNVYTADLPNSGFVPVRILFANAGIAEVEVLTVPPEGIYEGITVEPPAPPA
ncbi:MAG: hypothetical protein WAO41_00445 [Candidatus Nanopelagicales bacterium]